MACRISIGQTKRLEASPTGSERGAWNGRRWAASHKRQALSLMRWVLSRVREGREARAGRDKSTSVPPLLGRLRIAVLVSCALLHTSSAIASDRLQFTEPQLNNVREGYVTLSWNAYPSAAEYELTSTDGHSVYRGPFPKAFISGLADGTYEYRVDALDAGGRVLATTATTAVVKVEHWSLRLALALLTCGFVVFLVVVGLLVKGTLQTRSRPASSSGSQSSGSQSSGSQSSERSSGAST